MVQKLWSLFELGWWSLTLLLSFAWLLLTELWSFLVEGLM